jgi:glycosyltransferase involved in cell wall biosynthesis
LVLVGGREVGDAPAEELARRWPRYVIRLPRFSTEQIPAVVAAAHVVVAPQRDTHAARAQFPMKLTDAMAMAKPIITTRVGDIPEVLDGAAFVVPPSSPEAIAAALRDAFERPDHARRLGEEARRRCVERYSVEALGKTLAGVLAGATARSPR